MKTLIQLLLSTVILSGAALANDLPSAPSENSFPQLNMDEVKLGQLLFYDPIISGNKNISCATCHHPKFGTSDGVSLAIGEGGIGLGPDRKFDPMNPPEDRIPRNAPALFNLGNQEFSVLFHDGRIEKDETEPTGFRTPLGADMDIGFDSVLSAQTMFPVLSADEMAGHFSENDISQLVRQGRISGPNGAWATIAKRVDEIPQYRSDFAALLGTNTPVQFTDISNAIAAFISFEWRSDNSAFDQYLRGESALSTEQDQGLGVFYGTAGCAGCHSGPFQTDHKFHAMGVPQLGPGKAASFESHARDIGRMRVTGKTSDEYAFRTPSLRNVAITGPYGHDGAYATLRGFIKAHIGPKSAIDSYDKEQSGLIEFADAIDWVVLDDPAEAALISNAATDYSPVVSVSEIELLVSFLSALSENDASKGRLGVPDTVPSGLPIDK